MHRLDLERLAQSQSDLAQYWRPRWYVRSVETCLTVFWMGFALYVADRYLSRALICLVPTLYWYNTLLYYAPSFAPLTHAGTATAPFANLNPATEKFIGEADTKTNDENNLQTAQETSRISTTEQEHDSWAFPKAWFKIADSFDLAEGQVKSCCLAGQELVLFRAYTGQVTVADAYCPHLGANLAVGGRVVNENCIECPFHGWQFNGNDGTCAHIPYSSTTSADSHKKKSFCQHTSLRLWHVVETNQMILVWYGTPEPEWTYTPLDASVLRRFHGKSEHFVRCRLQDIPENGADIHHLNALHQPFLMEVLGRWFSHGFKSTWQASKEKDSKHIAHSTIETWINFCGNRIPGTTSLVDIQQIGPGIVHLCFRMALVPSARAVLIQSVTPIATNLNKLQHVVYGDAQMPRILAQMYLASLAHQVDRDAMVWNHKCFQPQPNLVREELTVRQYRRWFRQFYDKSPRFNASSDTTSTTSSLQW